jgi:hypothetical protein
MDDIPLRRLILIGLYVWLMCVGTGLSLHTLLESMMR